MKKVTAILLVVFFCIVWSASAAFAAEKIVIKWGDPQPKSYAYWPATLAFKNEVEKKTGGRVEIQMFGDGTLGDTKTLIESVLVGSIQMCSTSSITLGSYSPEQLILTLPFIWPNPKVVSDFLVSDQWKRIGALLETKGMKLIASGYLGYSGIQNSKREVKTPADLKGLKIRSLQNPIMIDTINAMGGMAVAMGASELYSAVQQGVLDGVATAPAILYSQRIYEVAKYFTLIKSDVGIGELIMNLKFWNSLPPDIQKVMMEASATWKKEVDNYNLDPSRETSEPRMVDLIRKAGVKVTEPDFAAFQNATKSVVRKYREKLGPEHVDPVLKFTGYKLD